MATLLPNGKQTFLDQNGDPLVGGSVAFYVPGSSTPKDTYQDAGSTILNTNPVILDGAGSAIIYGSGSYRQVVKDSAGNIIWDQITTDTSSAAIWAGTSGGLPNAQTVNVPSFSNNDGQPIDFIAGATNTGAFSLLPNGGAAVPVKKDVASGPAVLTGGEIVKGNTYRAVYDASAGIFHITPTPSSIPTGAYGYFATPTAPFGWLQCNGAFYQTSLYPGLFAAIGYNYGGSGALFAVPDGLGRTLASLDGGSGRLNGWGIGQAGGESAHALTVAENAPHNHGGSTGTESNQHQHTVLITAGGSTNVTPSGSTGVVTSASQQSVTTSSENAAHSHSIPTDGSGTAHNNVQPTLVGLLCIKT